MPDYTPDQKAAAFDALWETCGLGRGLLRDWVGRPVSRAAKEATFIRVPRYTFEILAEGEGMQRFRDVLHHLATRKGPNAEFSGVPAGHSSNHPAGGTSAATQG